MPLICWRVALKAEFDKQLDTGNIIRVYYKITKENKADWE